MWIVWLEKKILKTLGIILSIIVVLATALHVYVVNNAEKLIEELVFKESDGKLIAKVKNIKFSYFNKNVELYNVSISSNDSLDLTTSYHFQADNIRLRVKALLPIFTRKELHIDSLTLLAPKIEVIRIKPLQRNEEKELSISGEMGRVYNTIMNALELLAVKRFQFDEGQFRLINKVNPQQLPLEITNMHFHLENFKVDEKSKSDEFPDSDKIVFWTKGQDIIFPDGNHQLAFSRFRIKVKKKIIEIDSCTLRGNRNDGSGNMFSLFLDTLKLSNVDFKSLYEKELIKADSVYCLNPDFKIQFEIKNKKTAKANIPNLDTLINQLTGDMLLGYIGVKNASIDITARRNDRETSFTSDKNNFEMKGLSIDHSLPQPVSLESFDMAIHNYKNYVKDSSYILRFDSIRLRENKILLSNFSINTEPFKDKRNIRVQQFILSGLSWDDLIFDRKIIAQQATLFRPVIDYTQFRSPKLKTRNPLANSLAGINSFMSLNKLKVENGIINIKTLKNIIIKLDDADLLLNSKNLPKTFSINNTESAIEMLAFKKGILKTDKLIVNMDNYSYAGSSNNILLEKVNIYNNLQSFNVNARDITIDSLVFNDTLNLLTSEKIKWGKAQVEINDLDEEKKKANKALLFIFKNIDGSNTQLYLNSAKNTFAVFLNEIKASTIEKNDVLRLYDLSTKGKELNWYKQFSNLVVENFNFTDNVQSFVNNIQFRQSKNDNLIEIKSPATVFTTSLESIMKSSPDIRDVELDAPEILISSKIIPGKKEKTSLPDININAINITNPKFAFEIRKENGTSRFNWDGTGNNLVLKKIISNKNNNRLSVDSALTNLTSFDLISTDKKPVSAKQSSFQLTMSDLLLQNGDSTNWSLKIVEADMKNFTADSFGKKPANIKINTGKLNNLSLGTTFGKTLKTIIQNNPSFKISNISGSIVNEKNEIKWENINYIKEEKLLLVDSFAFHPVQNRDEFISESPWQTDYITFNSGKINISDFNIDQYLEDSAFKTGTISVDNPYFTSYRDKRPPFHSGIYKPLASKLIQKIPVKVFIDTIQINNGKVVYTELNDKNNETGVIPITRMSGVIFPIKNYNILPTDSLRIRINGYLLDTGWIRLRTRESYMDSLSGFVITLRMRPHSMLYLNKILEPLASVKLQSGYLDTLNMRAAGRDNLSIGDMRMYYHDLKVQFLRNSSEDKKRFLKGLMTFIANSFVIKNANKKRSGVVYFPRLRDRSFINYYIKIAMSGVASSVGAKKNKRLLRRYKKQLKIRHLPSIEAD